MGLRKKKSLLDQANDWASDYVEAAKPHVEAAYESAREFVQDTAVPALLDARDKAGPVLADARDKAAPVLADARERAGAAASDARDKAAPLIASGAAIASERAAQAKTIADAKVAQLKGEPPPKKGGKLKKFVLFAGIAGAWLGKRLTVMSPRLVLRMACCSAMTAFRLGNCAYVEIVADRSSHAPQACRHRRSSRCSPPRGVARSPLAWWDGVDA